MDREKVIEGLEMCILPNECSPNDCPYYIRPNNESGLCWDRLMTDAISLLKEQEETINDLTDTIRQLNQHIKDLSEYMTPYGKVKDVKAYAELLKEQKAIEPRRDANCVRMFRCGACGEYVGFIDSDPGDPNEQDNYCRNCGRAVKWT